MFSAVVIVTPARDFAGGIVRDASGRLLLGTWPSAGEPRGVTELKEAEPAQIGGPGWNVVGGALPAGAMAVEVRDRSGTWRAGSVAGGAWAVSYPDEGQSPKLPPVRYSTADGQLLRRPPPAGFRAIGDAEQRVLRRGGLPERCPACDSSAWGVTHGPGARRQVACGACGSTDGGQLVSFEWDAPPGER